MELPKPEIVRCYFERIVDAPLSAMELRWNAAVAERTWHLPDGVTFKGPAPHRFGVAIHRCDKNAYHVRVLWNKLSMSWHDLTRLQIMTSSLAPLLNALGTDLWHLLEQPLEEESLAA